MLTGLLCNIHDPENTIYSRKPPYFRIEKLGAESFLLGWDVTQQCRAQTFSVLGIHLTIHWCLTPERCSISGGVSRKAMFSGAQDI